MATYEVNNLTFSRDGDTYLIKIASKEVYYGISSTASGTQQKNVTINNLEKIEVGTQISITFTNAQTYNGKPTLKINNLAAATVNNGVVNMWQAGETVNFVYDGAYWLYIGSGVASTNKYGVTKLTNAVTSSSDTAITPAAVNELSEYLEDAIAQNVRGATSSANGAAGRVPAPSAGDQNKYLKGDGTWKALSTDSDFSDLVSLVSDISGQVGSIDNEINSINAEKARFIHLNAEDLTWDDVWAKINILENGETALITSESTQTSLLTNGGRTAKVYGTISRRSDNEFKYIFRANTNALIIADSVGSTSYLSGTYSERVITTEIDSKIRYIDLTSEDTTWPKIWEKLNVMAEGESALFHSWSTSTKVWANGRENTIWGIINRRSSNIFIFTWRLNTNRLFTSMIENATNSSTFSGTYTETEFASTSDRVIGTRIVATKGENSTNHTVTFPDGCCCFIVASMPGVARCWVGLVYTSTSGTVTFQKINDSGSIDVSVPSDTTNKLKFTWSAYSSSGGFNVLAIPFRGTNFPSV